MQLRLFVYFRGRIASTAFGAASAQRSTLEMMRTILARTRFAMDSSMLMTAFRANY